MWQDLVFALRQMGRSWRFYLLAAATLALGIGATTAIFSLVNGVLLRPLPLSQPEQLVQLRTMEFPPETSDAATGGGGIVCVSFRDGGAKDIRDWRSDGVRGAAWRCVSVCG